MHPLLDVSPEDIQALNDTDLRNLVGRLCEADLRAGGLSTSGVTYSGAQDAPDGGVDVRVSLEGEPPVASWLCRRETVIQVKCPDMPHAEILKEMAPEENLRESICDMIDCGGAYLIVCSGGSVADPMLRRRLEAMREAVEGRIGSDTLHTDFIDRVRLASWVRTHPPIAVWVRERVGRPVEGWRPYGDWVGSPIGVEDEYLADDQLRIQKLDAPIEGGMSTGDGMLHLQSTLAAPGKCVRLVGLSGVGKTRLVQALFDERVLASHLFPGEVLYTDTSDHSSPDPVGLVRSLVESGARAVVVIDNCSAQLHRSVAQIVSGPRSSVSLISVEYDVRDDLPEFTESVVAVEPASDELIKRLIIRRNDQLQHAEVDRIAHFSGGNARVALALARVVDRGESVAELRDAELLDRLLWQRNPRDPELLRAVTCLSLAYSFDSEGVGRSDSELASLAGLANLDVARLYSLSVELQRRDLIQARGKWRAVLPHAIANRFASRLLEDIPLDTIATVVEGAPSIRLARSFCRRIGLLHSSEQAVLLARRWLAPDGWIGRWVHELDTDGQQVFECIAPVSPADTLEAIERALEQHPTAIVGDRHWLRSTLAGILRRVAYDGALFLRSVKVLISLAGMTEPRGSRSKALECLQSLFYCQLSGTNATSIQRFDMVAQLLGSEIDRERRLGVQLMGASLEARHFNRVQDPTFGARAQGYGRRFSSDEEVTDWFQPRLELVARLVEEGHPESMELRTAVATCLPGMLRIRALLTPIEQFAARMSQGGSWVEGWLAVRSGLRFDEDSYSSGHRERVLAIDALLSAKTLADRARLYALDGPSRTFLIEDGEDPNEPIEEVMRRHDAGARSVGIEVASVDGVLDGLLPDLLISPSTRGHLFAEGLAEGAQDVAATFCRLVSAASNVEPTQVRGGVLGGYVKQFALDAPHHCDEQLEVLAARGDLGYLVPVLEIAAGMSPSGIVRLLRVAGDPTVPAWAFYPFRFGDAAKRLSEGDFVSLFASVREKSGGQGIVCRALASRVRGADAEILAGGALDFAAAFLLQEDYSSHEAGSDRDYDLSMIANAVFHNSQLPEVAEAVLREIFEGVVAAKVSQYDFQYTVDVITREHPSCFLDAVLGRPEVVGRLRWGMLSEDLGPRSGLIGRIPIDVAVAWCESDAVARYPLIVEACGPSDSGASGGCSWPPMVLEALNRAPDPGPVLAELEKHLEPNSWHGNRSEHLRRRLSLLDPLSEHAAQVVRAWATSARENLQAKIAECERDEALERGNEIGFE